ncbi:hypothetical protein HaLaN_15334 [Haematococcus lacustris]|uniref:Uncharacterized protein n=1 Tax=Haematococcus lacustris TaxID=44745 RepID=A0A699ZA45_HAELA|nr:hypothetical protein HaLaN_15334 [Haematococcus lacustris]
MSVSIASANVSASQCVVQVSGVLQVRLQIRTSALAGLAKFPRKATRQGYYNIIISAGDAPGILAIARDVLHAALSPLSFARHASTLGIAASAVRASAWTDEALLFQERAGDVVDQSEARRAELHAAIPARHYNHHALRVGDLNSRACKAGGCTINQKGCIAIASKHQVQAVTVAIM